MSDIDELQYHNFQKEYQFSKNNEYSKLENPLLQIKSCLEGGNSIKIKNILEAHLQKNPTDSKGWRALGITL